jgi:hypothetical protein
MEKIMFFGIAIMFGLMTALPPKPVKMPPRPVPVNGAHDTERVTPNEPNAVADKPNTVPVCCEFWLSPE